MSIHFAYSRKNSTSPIARVLARRPLARAANDNPGTSEPNAANDQLMHAALRHFARHGLGAAAEARRMAETAFFAGDAKSYDWWLRICRMLDRNVAMKIPGSQ